VSSSGVVRPLSLTDIQPSLQQRYTAALDARRDKTRVEQLRSWGRHPPAPPPPHAELTRLWNVSQGAVSGALSILTREGYVLPLPREGASATQYVLSGTSRLIFG
jgi:DNA-binding FadR family transcriptional regulator